MMKRTADRIYHTLFETSFLMQFVGFGILGTGIAEDSGFRILAGAFILAVAFMRPDISPSRNEAPSRRDARQ